MKIVDKRINESVLFETLEYGDVFTEYNLEDLFIRTDDIVSETTGSVYNAVYLKNGTHTHFDSKEEVCEIKAKVVIE